MFTEEDLKCGISDGKYLRLLDEAEKASNRKLVGLLNLLLWLGAKVDEKEELEDIMAECEEELHALEADIEKIQLAINNTVSVDIDPEEESRYFLRFCAVKVKLDKATNAYNKICKDIDARVMAIEQYRQDNKYALN